MKVTGKFAHPIWYMIMAIFISTGLHMTAASHSRILSTIRATLVNAVLHTLPEALDGG